MRIFLSGESIRGGEKWSIKGSYIAYKRTELYDWAFSPLVF